MSIGRRLKYYRKKRGFTQEYVADMLGIKSNNYNKYESGERNPKEERIMALIKILDVSYDNLVRGEEAITIDLLNSHLRGAVLGNIDSFYAFSSDFHACTNVSHSIIEHLRHWENLFNESYSLFHDEFIDEPTIASLVELDRRYKRTFEFNRYHKEGSGESIEHLEDEHMLGNEQMDDEVMYRLAFCVATEKYLDLSPGQPLCVDCILSDTRNYLDKDNMNDEDTLKAFAVLVLAPFLSHLLETLEFIAMNSSDIDDFTDAFLFGGLSSTGLMNLEEDSWEEDTENLPTVNNVVDNEHSMQDKLFFNWMCCVRTLPFLATMGDLECWVDMPGNEQGDFRLKYLYDIMRTLDLTMKAAHNVQFLRELDNEGGRKETHYLVFSIVQNMSGAMKACKNNEGGVGESSYLSIYYAAFCLSMSTFTFGNFNKNTLLTEMDGMVEHSMGHVRANAITASRVAGYSQEQYLLNDMDLITDKKTSELKADMDSYGPIWNDFISMLKGLGCDYWADLYADIFAKSFALTEDDLKELDRRLEVPRDIQEQGAAAVGEYLKR